MNKVKILRVLHEIVTVISAIQETVREQDYPKDVTTKVVVAFLSEALAVMKVAHTRLRWDKGNPAPGANLEGEVLSNKGGSS